MNRLAPSLIAAAAAILLVLGAVHLFITFAGPLMQPRDRELQQRMAKVSPVISLDTTMWRAWQGFNASHALGALLFGAVYGDLALFQRDFLRHAAFLLWLGLGALIAWLVLAVRHWFRVPLAGILVATLSYVAGLVV